MILRRRTYWVVASCMLAAIVGCSTIRQIRPAPAAEEGVLPKAGFAEGWIVKSALRAFGKDTLSEHINGEAGIYFPYGFKTAQTITYVNEADAEFTVQADVYEMGSALDAFGIYSNYRNTDSRLIPIGAEGFGDAYSMSFHQDRYFVRLNAIGEPPHTEPALAACARAIAGRLPGTPTPPFELSCILVDGVLPSSVRYISQSLLGYEFFTRGLTGDVDPGPDQPAACVFVVLTPSKEGALAALENYTAYLQEKNAEYQWTEEHGAACLIGVDPLYQNVVVQQAGNLLVGAAKAPSLEAGKELAKRLRDRAEKLP